MAAFPDFPRAANTQSDPSPAVSRSAPQAAVDTGAIVAAWTGAQPYINFVSIGPVLGIAEAITITDSGAVLTIGGSYSEAVTITDSGVTFAVGVGAADTATISEADAKAVSTALADAVSIAEGLVVTLKGISIPNESVVNGTILN
jgi:hypothetical protein